MSLHDYAERFKLMRVSGPHKVCMLLAVLDLARAGLLRQNRIVYGPDLLERYAGFFQAVRFPNQHPNPNLPFFHLRGALTNGQPSFWHLEPLPGREQAVATMTAAPSPSALLNNIAFAALDEELFDLLQSQECIDALGGALAQHWFQQGLTDLDAAVGAATQISRYERVLRDDDPPLTAAESPPPKAVRDPAFRRVVLESYDFRCAATGLRVVLNDNTEAMVEAAHIVPFSESNDDDPRNGIALTPNMHWAMDRNLIAPGPDFLWHVSSALDDRIPDFRVFAALDGRKIFKPGELRRIPRQDVLRWRLDRLRDPSWRAQ
jgi:putative restriction endonuclease